MASLETCEASGDRSTQNATGASESHCLKPSASGPSDHLRKHSGIPARRFASASEPLKSPLWKSLPMCIEGLQPGTLDCRTAVPTTHSTSASATGNVLMAFARDTPRAIHVLLCIVGQGSSYVKTGEAPLLQATGKQPLHEFPCHDSGDVLCSGAQISRRHFSVAQSVCFRAPIRNQQSCQRGVSVPCGQGRRSECCSNNMYSRTRLPHSHPHDLSAA